jgi:hypothetical protein
VPGAEALTPDVVRDAIILLVGVLADDRRP